jgi:rhodanese-related sulfurtransferase
MAARGDARWLDCRWPDEFSDHHIPHAISIPAEQISHRLQELDRRYAYIVCCQTGRRAEAVVTELRGNGFRAHVLAGGLQAWPYAIEFREQRAYDQKNVLLPVIPS